MVKPKAFFGPSQEISFTVITLNPESNFTRQEKNPSLFHLNTLTLPEPPTRRWMWCRRNILKTTGTLWRKRTVGCMDRFHKIHCIEFNATGWICMVQGGDWREDNRPQGPTNYGQKCGNMCLTHQNVKRNRSALSRNQSSIVPEDCAVFILWSWRRGFGDIMKNARRKLEIPMPAAMPL